MRKFLFVAVTAVLFSGTVVLQAKDDKGGSPEKGKEVFEKCSGCHNDDSTEAKMGPGLKGLFSRDKLVTGKKMSYDNVLDLVNNGDEKGMPAFKEMLSDQEKKDVLAYLQTL